VSEYRFYTENSRIDHYRDWCWYQSTKGINRHIWWLLWQEDVLALRQPEGHHYQWSFGYISPDERGEAHEIPGTWFML